MNPTGQRDSLPTGWAAKLSWLLIGLLLVLLAGCGGGGSNPRSRDLARWGGMSEKEWREMREKWLKEEEEKARREQEEVRRQVEERRRKEMEQLLKEREARRKPKPEASDDSSQEGQQADANPKPDAVLPASVREWNDGHYLLARRYAPERLLEAIRQMAPLRQNDPQWIDLLVDLVWEDKGQKTPGGGDGEQSSAPSRHSQAILEAVADVLAALRSDRAAQALRDILAGQVPTENYSLAMRTVLLALAKHRCPDHDRLLLQAVLGPENLLVASLQLQAQALQQEALRVVSNQAEPELQEQLARYVHEPLLAPKLRILIEQTFVPARWDHLRANLVLVQSGRTSPAVRSAILRQWALWSAQAVQAVTYPDGPARPAEELARARQMAELLWRPERAAILEGIFSPAAAAAGAVADPALEAAAAQLAMTIPAGWARQALADWLQLRWTQRPDEFRKAVHQMAWEPGFLVVLARLLHQQIEPLMMPDPSAKRKPLPGKAGLVIQTQMDRARQQALGQTAAGWVQLWDAASQGLSEAILQGLSSSGGLTLAAPAISAAASASGAFPLPLRLPTQAKLLTSWKADLADQAQKLGWNLSVESTKVYLSRWQLTEAPPSLVDRLQRSLPQARRRMVPPGIVLHGLGHAKEQNLLRVVKIYIRPLSPDIPHHVQEEQPLLVEALAVEIPYNEQKFVTSAPSPGDASSPKRDQ